ncbi:MAG: methyltransferase domain-containing protein [Candidatus Bathyarchaeota archaeon]
MESDVELSESVEGLRLQLVESQERLLFEATKFWDVERILGGVVLDVGCGLGGSSIFLAEEFGSKVYALTNVPDHIKLIRRFSIEAGVADSVTPLFGDALNVPGDHVFDVAVAVESSCYLDREAWFSHLSERITGGGYVFIADCFAVDDRVRTPFNEYWLTDLGTLDEYLSSAKKAGFREIGVLDITVETSGFWGLSIEYSNQVQKTLAEDDPERKRLGRSIAWQTRLASFWDNKEIMCAFLSFRLG